MPADHPPRPIRAMVNEALLKMNGLFAGILQLGQRSFGRDRVNPFRTAFVEWPVQLLWAEACPAATGYSRPTADFRRAEHLRRRLQGAGLAARLILTQSLTDTAICH